MNLAVDCWQTASRAVLGIIFCTPDLILLQLTAGRFYSAENATRIYSSCPCSSIFFYFVIICLIVQIKRFFVIPYLRGISNFAASAIKNTEVMVGYRHIYNINPSKHSVISEYIIKTNHKFDWDNIRILDFEPTTNNKSSPHDSRKKSFERRHKCQIPKFDDRTERDIDQSQYHAIDRLRNHYYKRPLHSFDPARNSNFLDLANPTIPNINVVVHPGYNISFDYRYHFILIFLSLNSLWYVNFDLKATLGDMLLDERLSLTLDEIVHIRSVLTKAELESLPVEGRVKEDVEKRRVCFLCLKTRFGLLGPWGQRCRLCKRTVCVKCYSKMRIPTEQFARVPVVLLSPGLLLSPTETESDSSKNSWLRNAGTVGSAPASPASRRKDSALRSGTPASTPTMTPISALTPTSTPPSHARREMESQELDKRCYKGSGSPAALSTTKTFSTSSGPSAEQHMAAERLRGVAVVVCHDCRIMVIQIIKSSRTTRATIRNNVISRLTLNLSPAYI
ncbi:hypothetical protein P5V15_001037 [Pogonomyrmex californicus]